MDETYPNPDLAVDESGTETWNLPAHRRTSFHNFEATMRYTSSFRSARVLKLDERTHPAIGAREDVGRLTALPAFSAMVVVKDDGILFERHADDFGRENTHSLMSVTKLMMNLVIGGLVESGQVDLDRRVRDYLPEIGTGYADATVQQVLDMDLDNVYSEDLRDPDTMFNPHEEAMGWRLPGPGGEQSIRSFLLTITSDDVRNRSGEAQYKNTNTDVLGWIAERASGRPLRSFYADIVDAAGIAGTFSISTDREGTPSVNGGGSISALDLARIGALVTRRGAGVDGGRVGSAEFLESSLIGGLPFMGLRYRNQTQTDGRFLGHAGSAGQFLYADMVSGVVSVYLSVCEEPYGDIPYYPDVVEMLREIGRAV